MATLTFRVPDAVAARLAAHARSRGGKSAVMRRLVEEALGSAPAPGGGEGSSALPAIAAALGPSAKVTIRLREEEVVQVATLAADRGMSRTQWITSLVRARLGVAHPRTGDERVALRAIARELNRIGGNVNQIARAVDIEARSGRPAPLDAGAIADATAAVSALAEALRQALGRSADYWDVGS